MKCWSENGLKYERENDLYSLHEKAANLIDKFRKIWNEILMVYLSGELKKFFSDSDPYKVLKELDGNVYREVKP